MIDLTKYQIEYVPVSAVNAANRMFQVRVDFSIEDIEESFKEKGQEEPIILWRRHPSTGSGQDSGELVVICGRRRLTTAIKLVYRDVKAIVIPESDAGEQDVRDFGLDDNVKRKSLTELDLMYECIKRLQNKESAVRVAKITGKSRPMVSNYKLIGESPQEIQDAIKTGKISIKKVVTILRSSDTLEGGLPAIGSVEGVSTVDRGGTEGAEKSPKLIENTGKLLEALRSSVPKKSVQNLLNEDLGSCQIFDKIPGFEQTFESTLKKRKKRQKSGQIMEKGAIPFNARYKNSKLEFQINLDFSVDSGESIIEKADLMEQNAKILRSHAKSMPKLMEQIEKQARALKRQEKKEGKAQKQKLKEAEKTLTEQFEAAGLGGPASSAVEPGTVAEKMKNAMIKSMKNIGANPEEYAKNTQKMVNVVKKMQEQAPNVTANSEQLGSAAEGIKLEDIFLKGPSRVAIGATAIIKAEAYDENYTKIDTGNVKPAWEVDDRNLGEITQVSSCEVSFLGKSKGLCFVTARLGKESSVHGIEVVQYRKVSW